MLFWFMFCITKVLKNFASAISATGFATRHINHSPKFQKKSGENMRNIQKKL